MFCVGSLVCKVVLSVISSFAGCFTLIVALLSCRRLCSVSLLHFAVGLTVG